MNVFSPPDPTTIDVGQKSLLGMQVNVPTQKSDPSGITHSFRFQSQESGKSSAPFSVLRSNRGLRPAVLFAEMRPWCRTLREVRAYGNRGLCLRPD